MDVNLEYKKIKSIKRIHKKQQVYNFNVPGYESYVANGFVVHNCENTGISAKRDYASGSYFTVEDVLKFAKDKQVNAICMSYNEPTIYYEYLLDLANEAHLNRLPFLLKTNAYINQNPWKKICSSIDAVNIDFKGSAENYKELLGASDYVIYSRISEAIESGINVEISIPIYDGISFKELKYLADFLSERDRSIGIHLLNVHPTIRCPNQSSTSVKDLQRAKNIFCKKFKNIFRECY
jgi:pyruvate formate lyase activating enzyme